MSRAEYEAFPSVYQRRLNDVVEAQQMDDLRDLVGRGPGGRELSLALTKLEEAEQWMRTMHAKVIAVVK